MEARASAYYRFVRPFDWYYGGDVPRLASSAFKDGQGYSVDRDLGSSAEVCVIALHARRTRGDDNEGVISFAATDVAIYQVGVLEAPEPGNPFHCIFLDDKAATVASRRLGQGTKVKCLQKCHRVERVVD